MKWKTFLCKNKTSKLNNNKKWQNNHANKMKKKQKKKMIKKYRESRENYRKQNE